MTTLIENQNCGVYSITNLDNGKVYIGSSKNIRERWWRHKHDLKLNQHPNRYLQRSYNKHGIDNFLFEIITYCDENERHDIEDECKSYFDAVGLSYNIAPVEQPPIVHMGGETNGMYRGDVPPPEELAKEYMDTQISINKLAEKYGCGVNTIRRRLDKSSINTHKKSEQKGTYNSNVPGADDLLFEYENNNLTYDDLAAKYNCTKSLITHRLRKARGYSTFKHSHVPGGDELLVEYETSNITQKQMANKYNCTVSCIEYRLRIAREKRKEKLKLCTQQKDIKS